MGVINESEAKNSELRGFSGTTIFSYTSDCQMPYFNLRTHKAKFRFVFVKHGDVCIHVYYFTYKFRTYRKQFLYTPRSIKRLI